MSSSVTLPASGLMLGGRVYGQPTSGRLMGASGGSPSAGLLKTPTAQLAVNGGSQHPDKRRQGGHGPTLADQVEHELLPTPRATDGTKGGPNQRGSAGDLMLPSAVMNLLPTPTAEAARQGWNTRRGGARAAEPVLQSIVQDAVAGALLPTPTAADGDRASLAYARGNPTLAGALLPTPTARLGDDTGRGADSGPIQGTQVAERPPEQPGRLHSSSGSAIAVASADTDCDGLPRGQERDSEPLSGQASHEQRRVDPQRCVLDWGIYGAAIARWEAILGRPAPRPTEPGRTGERLSPRFVEWMQGLPDGWVTDAPGLSRNAQLKALGNGVVPQQAAVALRLLLPALECAA